MSSEQARAYHSITIGTKNTWDDWHLVPTSRPLVEPPEVQTSYVTIPGSYGTLDLTEALTGYPTYGDRTGSWEFIVMNDYWNWETAYSEIMGYLHGKSYQVILDDDPGYYYEGRLSVDGWKSGKGWSTITIRYRFNPFKIEILASDEEWKWDTFNFETGIIRVYKDLPISGQTSITVINEQMRLTPTIKSNATMTLAHRGKTYTISSGNNTPRDLKLIPGTNVLTFSGNGSVSISFHGGRF